MSEETLPVGEGELKNKMDLMMERLGMVKDADGHWVAPEGGTTEVTAEAAEAALAEDEALAARGEQTAAPAPFDPAKEDWSQYDIDQNIAHLYPKSVLHRTEDSVQLLAPWVELQFKTGGYNAKHAKDIEILVNGPEQWQIAAILPNGSGLLGFVLQRGVRKALPLPQKFVTETEVAAPTDPELDATEAAALAWAGQVETPAPSQGALSAADEAVKALDGVDFGTVEPTNE